MKKKTPVSITKIILYYEDGTKLIVDNHKSPIAGKLFFDTLEKNDVEWKVEDGKESFIKKTLNKFLSI